MRNARHTCPAEFSRRTGLYKTLYLQQGIIQLDRNCDGILCRGIRGRDRPLTARRAGEIANELAPERQNQVYSQHFRETCEKP